MGGQGDDYIDLTSGEPGTATETVGTDAGRSLQSLLAGMARDGRRIRIEVSGANFAGSIRDLGPDCVSLETICGRVDIHVVPTVPIQIEVLEGEAAALDGLSAGGATFGDCLRGWADDGVEVSVGVTFDEEPLFGSIEVGTDHLGVVSRLGRHVYVTTGAVAFVTARDV